MDGGPGVVDGTTYVRCPVSCTKQGALARAQMRSPSPSASGGSTRAQISPVNERHEVSTLWRSIISQPPIGRPRATTMRWQACSGSTSGALRTSAMALGNGSAGGEVTDAPRPHASALTRTTSSTLSARVSSMSARSPAPPPCQRPCRRHP